MITRRQTLRLAAALGLAPALSACGDGGSSNGGGDGLPTYDYTGPLGPATLFSHGVASGDPLPDRVILWTRVTPADAAGSLEIFWEIAEDPDFTVRRNAGRARAVADADYTVKIDADRLQPGTDYYYRFRALGRDTMLGRTRTAPSGDVANVRFAVASCSNYAFGYFHSYRHIAAREDLDAVLHLGDYIYEYGDGEYGDLRPLDPPHEIVTLDDYRRRYAHYHTDADLQALHARHPMIAVWDDHESADNSWRDGAVNHDADEGEWRVRRAAAEQVYREWMPIRTGDDGRIWRTLRYGDLVDLFMLDTRLWGRDAQLSPSDPAFLDPTRTILGADQEAWLDEELRDSTARWRVLGQQVMLGPWKLLGLPNSIGGGNIANEDQWDGYRAARARLFGLLREQAIDNVVVLTGDLHMSWALDLNDDPNEPLAYDPVTGDGSIAVEFVVPSVTSPGLPGGNPQFRDLFLSQNPHILWGDVETHGYVVLDVTPERAEASYLHVGDIEQRGSGESVASTWTVLDGANRLRR